MLAQYRVPSDGSFRLDAMRTAPAVVASGVGRASREHRRVWQQELEDQVDRLAELQRQFYAHDRYALLLVFQAMDAAGKDSTIRAVLSGVNPAGCQVESFKQPSKKELDHDFLWRTAVALPERGRIGVFNRSHYEEVLVVRVHPEYLGGQKMPAQSFDPATGASGLEALWQSRYESIRDFEKHLARNGTVILKFFLNVSRAEQANRFLDRLVTPRKNWKFSLGDLKERELWDRYMEAYEDALRATSTPWAPWFVIPADDKKYMRKTTAQIITDVLEGLSLAWPFVEKGAFEQREGLEQQLRREASLARRQES